MNLRNFLLALSILTVSLLGALYFQSGEEVQTINWDQYKNLPNTEDISFSLEDLNHKITPGQVESIIQEIREKNRLAGEKTRIMEIGFRHGRVLMTLKKKFPDVEFYGINRIKTHDFYRRESFIQTSLRYEIMSQKELENIELPYVIFQSLDMGNKIPYDENKFDLIYSQDVIRLIKYKFELFNEVMRILKPGGISFHTNVNNIPIYSKGLATTLKEATQKMKRHHIDISYSEETKVLRFKKSDETLIFPLNPHQPLPENRDNVSKEFLRSDMGYNLNI